MNNNKEREENMTNKWEKHRIGKLFGDTVFIELPPGLSGKEHNQRINQAALFLEQAFRNSDFLQSLKEIISEQD